MTQSPEEDRDTVALGSDAWLAAVGEALRAEAAQPRWAHLTFSMSETLTSPPPDVRPTEGELGWSCRVERGSVDFQPTPSGSAEFRASVDFGAATQLAPLIYGTDPEAAIARKNDLEARGLMHTEGTRGQDAVDFMIAVHDRLAPITAPPADA